MARLNHTISTSDSDHLTPSSPRRPTGVDSPRSDVSIGSDKENRHNRPSKRLSHKRKTITAPMAERGESSASASKRRRIESQRSHEAQRDQRDDGEQHKFYDPDQNMDEIRATKKQYRDLIAKVNDERTEYLRADNRGLEKALGAMDEIFKGVKQTSVAAIDSGLLVNLGDLANKKVKTLTLGDSTSGVDVDDFITKCIYFMQRGAPPAAHDPASTQASQAQRRRRTQADEGDDDEDGTEPMYWSHLGKNACILYNSRPALPGFLLGPLSVQKKVRQQTQRKARQTQVDPSQAARPRELAAEDLEKQESANLTVVCGEIARLLDRTITRGSKYVEDEYNSFTAEPSDEAVRDLMAKHGLTDNGCVPLFNFCVNPRSFGQTVENMFYVSFLIKEGKVGLDFDSNGLPTLGTAEQRSVAERQETQRNQAVFTLDFDVWREIVESFGIEKSIIPHRKEEEWDDGTLHDAVHGEISSEDGSEDDDDG